MSISTSDVQMAATLRPPHIHYQSSSGNDITPNLALVIRQHSIHNREGSSQQVSSLEKRLHLISQTAKRKRIQPHQKKKNENLTKETIMVIGEEEKMMKKVKRLFVRIHL